MLEVACAAHMRRYFYKARHSAPREAHRALVYFRQLYLLERELADVADADRRAQRRSRALPLLEEFKTWLDELAPTVVPKTEIAAAVGYALNQWEAFVRYCDEGWLMIDNTRSERALRPIAIGRSNWMFFGSDGGGHTGAISVFAGRFEQSQPRPSVSLPGGCLRAAAGDPRARVAAAAASEACAEVRFPDGTRPNLATLRSPLDCLRVLKDHPRPLIELMRDPSRLDTVHRRRADRAAPRPLARRASAVPPRDQPQDATGRRSRLAHKPRHSILLPSPKTPYADRGTLTLCL